MSALFHALGINGKALLFQVINFTVVLVVLNFAVYRPLTKIVEERRKKIELGLRGAEEVEKRLQEADRAKDEKIRQADVSAVAIITKAEGEARKRSEGIVGAADQQAAALLAEAARVSEQKKIEEMERLSQEAKTLIRDAIVKTVELDPAQVDEKLISQAVQAMKQSA